MGGIFFLGLGVAILMAIYLSRQAKTKKFADGTLQPKNNPANILPPLRRDHLATIKGFGPDKVTEEAILRQQIGQEEDFRTCESHRFTPTGFSAEEVRQLGDFPNYASLSGVALPNPYRDFDIERALPRPYRPFRWSYHQTMSISKMETDWWIELENTYRARLQQRKALYQKSGRTVLDYLPGSELACNELMEMVLQFLCARYPHYFSLAGTVFHNDILETTIDVTSKHPLEILLDNVPEDFAIMLRDDKTGDYYFRAGIICSSIGWTLSDKMGLRLDRIHDPVPDYKEKMEISMNRFFTKMPTDKPLQRGSWNLEIGQPLHLPKDNPNETERISQDPHLQLNDCYLRVDWQTLRRLPLSAGVVFNFKALFTPVTEFRDEPKIPRLLLEILQNGKKNLMDYKKTWHVEHVVVPKLKEWSEEQEVAGLVDPEWVVTSLDESPWFAGWEDKWHRQQGF
ncbi:hypothetical protein BO78DRAFT_446151 [Aspergillus sclerotiicarbonarius CBS 121057]|uniref:HRQ family protein n=1 Tax=Aspergillus sclerotiicarbonarius (strain CBS 121057 / IBT 28362) TaxID=1448318 RepID=A0A319FMZ5_ASPSB|nr:hypothetical protein BO78DRAFT_446151 [Aspergillus sclerotiicarbonarius CBS 121057]